MQPVTRRNFMKTMAGAATAAGTIGGFAWGGELPEGKNNVIILFIDDLGYGDLACFGNKQIPTPHIDSLAKDGARLTTSYITNPPCSPSRCSLLMGMYGQRFKKFGMARGLALPKDKPTLAEFMRDAGYVTGQIGKWDVGDKNQGPHQRGFMEVARWAKGKQYTCIKPDGSTAYRTEVDGDRMVEFVDRNKDKPFFLYFSPFAIHSPLQKTPKKYQDRVKGKDRWYGGAVAAVDDQVGRLLETLKKHTLDKKTLIILTGDNGANLNGGSSAPYRGGKGKGTQNEGWVRTPAIAWWPGVIPAGQTFDGMTCTLDYFATAAAVTGQDAPDHCDGKNILPYLTGKKSGDVHDYLYWYNADPKDSGHRHLSAVRWKDWRLLLNRKTQKWELYDLKKDPQERRNVIKDNRDVARAMKKKHAEFVATLPPLNSIPPYDRGWGKPPEGWGWIIGDGK